MKLSLAVTNLVENAIKYNVDSGWVRVILDADHKYFYIKVADSGIGIPEDSLDHIFERFFRVDKARSRKWRNRPGAWLLPKMSSRCTWCDRCGEHSGGGDYVQRADSPELCAETGGEVMMGRQNARRMRALRLFGAALLGMIFSGRFPGGLFPPG